jgi:uncharacterized protein
VLRRRDFIRAGLLSAGAATFGPGLWRTALAQAPAATPGPGPYGPLGEADGNGIRLPAGFSSRLIAQGLTPVLGTAYAWHVFSDGQATYPTGDGGWILVSNSEVPGNAGGASAIRFGADGEVTDAYRILSGTDTNCAGGRTPWGTWLSCEEAEGGQVWECDPAGEKEAVVHPALGVFAHEAVCVDPDGKRLYLSEDEGDGGFYRFTPQTYPDLGSGLLEVAVVNAGGAVSWRQVPDPSAATAPTRQQLPEMTKFRRGEGIWFDGGVVYLATTSDSKIHAYDTITETIEVLYDGDATEGPLREVDNVTVSRSGDLFVCEDADDLNIGIISPEREVAPFLQLTGTQHSESELCGAVFDPSGTRFYFASQRAFGAGAIYEVTGPFRQDRPAERFPPNLLVSVPDSIGARALSRRGLSVEVRASRQVDLSLTLRTVRLRRARRGLRRARQFLLGRRRGQRTAPGIHSLAVRPGQRGRRRLRALRPRRLELVVDAVDRFGNRRRISEEVAVTGRLRRR